MPISVFLIGYIALAILFWIVNIFIVYHLVRYSVDNDASRIMTAIFLLGSISLFFISVFIVFNIDWSVKF